MPQELSVGRSRAPSSLHRPDTCLCTQIYDSGSSSLPGIQIQTHQLCGLRWSQLSTPELVSSSVNQAL